MHYINRKHFVIISIASIIVLSLLVVIVLKFTIHAQPQASESTIKLVTKVAPDQFAAEKAAYYEKEGDTVSEKGNIIEAKNLFILARRIYETLNQSDAITRINAKIAKLDLRATTPAHITSPVIPTH
jgi:hypothetical protein